MNVPSWKILLVDDDEDEYLLTRGLLLDYKAGMSLLEWKSSYAEGMQALLTNEYDAALIDYDLGPIKGVELIREAVRQGCNIPLILYTGRGNYEVDMAAMEAGASDYLNKNEVTAPFLERAIRYAIERKRTQKVLSETNAALQRANADLKEERSRLTTLIENAPAGILLTDREGRYLFSNRTIEAMFGDVIGKKGLANKRYQWQRADGTFFPVEERPLRVALKQGKNIQNVEMRAVNEDQTEFIFLVNASPIVGADGEVTGAVTVMQDITGRKQADAERGRLLEQNRIQQEYLNGFFENAPAGMALFDAQPPHRILAHNRMYQEIWPEPFRSEGLVGRILAEFAPEHEQNRLYQFFELAAQTRQPQTYYHFEYRGLPRGRSWWNWSLIPIYSEGELAAFAFMINGVTEDELARQQLEAEVAERKRVEQALRESEQRFRQLADSMPQLVWTARPDGTVDYYNQRYQEYRGIQASDEKHWQWAPVLHEADQQATVEAWQTAVQTSGIYQAEHRVRMVDGGYRWHLSRGVPVKDDAGRVIKWYGTATDIHDQKQAEIALEQANAELRQREAELKTALERLRCFVDSNIVGIVVGDRQGNILEANDYYLNIVGYSRADLEAGRINWLEILPGPSPDAGLEQLKAGASFEKELTRKDGSQVWVLVGAALLPGEDGQVVSFVLDITDRKDTAEALNQYAARLERSNRELEEFAFIASHDLQEPLRKIEAFGERLRENSSGLSDYELDYIHRMINAAERMHAMIDALLELSRVTTHTRRFEVVDLQQVIYEVVQDLEHRIFRSKGQVQVGELPKVFADEIQMRQLFQNLIGNSLKFHQPGVPPVVRIYAQPEPNTNHGGEDQSRVQIFIEDNGIGFDMAQSKQIFQPFKRLVGRSEYEGSGMGLAICRKIVERHNGDIAVSSAPGLGTSFTVTLEKI